MSFSAAIADNHEATRLGICSVIESLNGEVVSTAETGLEALSMVDEQAPDLFVLSLRLPHLSGTDILCHLQRQRPEVTSLVLTVCEEEECVRAAFRRGASAYLLKRGTLEELRQAIRMVGQGRRYISEDLPTEWMESAAPEQDCFLGTDASLTLRERQVLQLTTEGYTSQEIGGHLDISPRTVDKHRENVKRKLGVRSLVEMAQVVLKREMVPNVRALRMRRGVRP